MTLSGIHKFGRYLVSGGVAAGANLVVLYCLTELFNIWYLASSVAAVAVGWIVSFLLQKFWTFGDSALDLVHFQFSLHTLLSLANIVLNTACMYILVEGMHLWYIAAQVLASAMLACVNYGIYKRYIFPS